MILQVFDLLAQHVLGTVAEEVTNARTDKRIALFQVDHQDEVRKAFQQRLTELFLLPELLLHLALIGNVRESSLIADDGASVVPYGSRSVEANYRCPVLPAKSDFACSHDSTVVGAASQDGILCGIEIQSGGFQSQQVRLV